MSKQTPIDLNKTDPPDPSLIQLGATVFFTPSAFYKDLLAVPVSRRAVFRGIQGTICYINRPHRYFLAEYDIGGHRLLEGFKF